MSYPIKSEPFVNVVASRYDMKHWKWKSFTLRDITREDGVATINKGPLDALDQLMNATNRQLKLIPPSSELIGRYHGSGASFDFDMKHNPWPWPLVMLIAHDFGFGGFQYDLDLEILRIDVGPLDFMGKHGALLRPMFKANSGE